MAKGGGRGKGRPREVMISFLQSGFTLATSSGAECSYNGKSPRSDSSEIAEDAAPTVVELDSYISAVKQIWDLNTEEEKEERAKKIEDGAIPPLRKRGMPLGYVAPHLK